MCDKIITISSPLTSNNDEINTPVFHGKDSESATKFLVQLQQYIQSVLRRDCSTVLPIIWQFLRNEALSWYYQLIASSGHPQTWNDFTTLFLLQFNAPINITRREREWERCRQNKNENINQFLIRFRTLWMEQRPNETEEDLAKHLLCRMRNDLCDIVKIRDATSLEQIIAEIQQIEWYLNDQSSNNKQLSNQLKDLSLNNKNIIVDNCSNKHYLCKTTTTMKLHDEHVQNGTVFKHNRNLNTLNRRKCDTTTREYGNYYQCCRCENCRGLSEIRPKQHYDNRLKQNKQSTEKRQRSIEQKDRSHTNKSVFDSCPIQLNILEIDQHTNINTSCIFCTVLCTNYCCPFCNEMSRSLKFEKIIQLLEECTNNDMWFDEISSLAHKLLEVTTG